jgi:acyl carrier protein
MNADEIRSAVLATISAIAPEVDVQSIRPDRPLRQQIDLDSIDWLNVVSGLCERLGVEIPEPTTRASPRSIRSSATLHRPRRRRTARLRMTWQNCRRRAM